MLEKQLVISALRIAFATALTKLVTWTAADNSSRGNETTFTGSARVFAVINEIAFSAAPLRQMQRWILIDSIFANWAKYDFWMNQKWCANYDEKVVITFSLNAWKVINY